MAETEITSEALHRYAKGVLEEEDRRGIERALEASADLRAELALLQALPEAFNAPDLDSVSWDRIEARTMAVFRKGPVSEERTLRSFSLKPALAIGLALFILVVAAYLLFPDAPISDPKIKLSPETAFDTGRAQTTGISVQVSVGMSAGEPELKVRKLSRGLIQAGDEIKTNETAAVSFEFGKHVSLALTPKSHVRFHEYDGELVPYLVNGTLGCEVRQVGAGHKAGLTVIAGNARIKDIGTRFTVRADLSFGGGVDVHEGEVLIERPGAEAVKVSAGNSGRWSSGEKGAVVSTEPGGQDAFVETARMFRKDMEKIKETRKAPKPGLKADPKTTWETTPGIRRRAETAENEIHEVVTPKAEKLKTSWQRTRESMPMIRRDALDRFHKTVEVQMAGGYTQRAIANLENFIENNPTPESEKAHFLLGECHYNLQEFDRAIKIYMDYVHLYPRGTWIELAKFRFAEIKHKKY